MQSWGGGKSLPAVPCRALPASLHGTCGQSPLIPFQRQGPPHSFPCNSPALSLRGLRGSVWKKDELHQHRLPQEGRRWGERVVLLRQADTISPPKIPFPIFCLSESTHRGGPALCHSPPGRLHLLADTAPWLTLAFPLHAAPTAPQRAGPPEDPGRFLRDHAAT